MDAEGINWVGNIYQKFEAMCLEVEEDTIKYVENQVETVGTNVKKFYSDVMQDLLPPFSSVAEKITVSNSPVVKYYDVDVSKISSPLNKDVTPMSCLNAKYENSESLKKKNSEAIAVVNKDVSPTSISGRLHENGDQFDYEELVINRNIGKKKLPQSKIRKESISTGRDACEALSLSEELNESKVNCPDAKKLFSVELHMALLDKYQSEEGIHDMITSSSTNFAEEPNGSWDQKPCCAKCLDLPDSWGSQALETEAAAETDKEMILNVDKLKLEETCVLVTKDDFHFVSLAGSDRRPYKKNIRRVFFSRKESARTQEYEELAILHGNSAKSNQVQAESKNSTSTVIDPKKSPHSEVCESEWELL